MDESSGRPDGLITMQTKQRDHTRLTESDLQQWLACAGSSWLRSWVVQLLNTGSYFYLLYISSLNDTGVTESRRAAGQLRHAQGVTARQDREGEGWTVVADSLSVSFSLFSPFWQSARRRSWWVPQSLGSVAAQERTQKMCFVHGKPKLIISA